MSGGEEAVLGRHSRTGRNINDGVSGAKARVQQKKSRKQNAIYKGAQRPWERGSLDEAYSTTKGDGAEQQILDQQSSGTVACTASGFCGSTAETNTLSLSPFLSFLPR